MKISVIIILYNLVLLSIFVLPTFEDDTKTTPAFWLTTEYSNVTNSSVRVERSYDYLLNALSKIFLGRPMSDNTTSIFDVIETADGTIDLNVMLVFARDGFFNFLDKNGYDDEEYFEYFDNWTKIIETLNEQGSSAVTLEMLRPFLLLLRPNNLFKFWKRINKVNDNFAKYIAEDFLENVKNPLCKRHVGLWFRDVGNAETWALTMFDAAGKPSTGLLNGNINWVGGYKQCNSIEVFYRNLSEPDFKGRYCRAHLGVPRENLPPGVPLGPQIGIDIGICVPNQCDDEDSKEIVKKSLQLLTLHRTLPVEYVNCEKKEPYSVYFYVFSSICLAIIAFVLLATIFDGIRRLYIKPREKLPEIDKIIELKSSITGSNVLDPKVQHNIYKQPKPSALTQFLLNCSMYANSERIFRTDNGGKFTCLNGLRAISMIWIIFGHTFNYIANLTYFVTVPNIRELQDLEQAPAAQLIINGMYGVDTFFLMSAFLLTYGFMKKLQKSGGLSNFEWFYYYVHRYWRLVPPYAIIIAIFIFIMPWLGYGPLWEQKNFPINNGDCKDYWWAYLLMINNFVPNGKGVKCMGYLWYVCNDYQLYALSPIFLIILFKFPIAGVILLLTTLASSVSIMAFLTANVYNLHNREIVVTLFEIWEDVYTKPYCRAGPWIIGILLGYLFFKLNKVKMNRFVCLFGWLISTVLALVTIFGGYTNHGKGWRRMEIMEYAAYFSLTRISWPISIGWVIFACHYGYGGIINRILSARAFLPLTRLSYCAYLIHPAIMVAYTFAQQGLTHATELSLVYLFFGHLCTTFIFCFFYTLFFEQPFIALEKLAMSAKKQNHED